MPKNLTDATLKHLKPDPTKRLEIPDGACTGLYHLIQPSGKRGWSVRYRLGDRIVKYTIGSYPLFGLVKARDEAQAVLRRVGKGEDPQAEKVAKKHLQIEDGDPNLFGNLCRLYLLRVARVKNKDWVEQARVLGLFPDPAQPDKADDPRSFRVRLGSPVALWGEKRVADISRSSIRLFLDKLMAPEDEGGNGMTAGANRVKSAISSVMSWAVDKELMEANPCLSIKRPAPENSRERTLDRDDEIRAVWLAACALGGSYGAIVRTLLLSGQRREEVAAMEWRELDLENRKWSIPGARTKNGLSHQVPLSDAMMAIIEAQPKLDNSPLVFPGKMITRPISGFSKFKERMDKKVMENLSELAAKRGDNPSKVTMEGWTLHDLRRTVATRMGDLDVQPHIVEAVLNHVSGSKAGVAGTYNRAAYAREKAVALDRWADFVLALVEGKASNVVALATKAKV